MTNTAYEQASKVDAGEPVAVDPETLEEMNQIKEDKLELLGASLASTRDKWIAARVASGVEKRWMDDIDQYLGKDAASKHTDMMDAVENGGIKPRNISVALQRSTVFVNITRPKTNAVEARLANMLYPTEDKAWGIKPTPNPKLTLKAMQEAKELAQKWQQMPQQAQAPAQGPQPMQMPTQAQTPGVAGGVQPAANESVKMPEADQNQGGILAGPFIKTPAQAEIDLAHAAAKAMEQEIEDALVECDFVGEARKMLHDVAVLGTGVLKGPIVVSRVSKCWQKVEGALGAGVYALQIVQELKPASECVSPWNVYPDPTCGNNIRNGKGIWEKKNLTGKMLRDLVGQPGYLDDQIRKVLTEGPRRATTLNARDVRDLESMGNEPMYECWEYWGDFDVEDLQAAGVEVKENSLKVVSGCIIMVNDTVIKGFVNPLECGSLPYDFMNLEMADNSVWGYGVPFLCRPAQKVLNAAWRQLMDNAALSTGPQIFVKPNIVQPADGVWQITGRKIWNVTDDSAKADEAIVIKDIPNNSQEFEKIINLAMMFADEESSVPKIVQGNNQSDSVGVTTIQMNSANVVLGRLVKQYDDYITRPHIRRYYDFFMAYSDKAEIKGDYQVDARGTSVLLVRDQQMQSLMQFGQFQSTPLAPMVHWHKWLKEVLKAQHLDPKDLLKSDSEIEQLLAQPPGPNPEQIKAEAAKEVANIRAQASLQTAEAREQGELAFANAQAQMARDNSIAKLKEMEMKYRASREELELKRDLAILEYANQQKMTLDAVKADLAKTSMIEETKRQVAAAKLQADADEKDKDRLHQAVQPMKGENRG
jgi:hypothetical protein